ncbi:MAG: histidinol dehydrogenase, partial [Bacteroidales bacterium]|nr:histidinol dehydrogenase [Bacteroidales bacterium]
MQLIINPGKNKWAQLVARPALDYGNIETICEQVLERVKTEGDKALFELTARFDGASLNNLQVSKKELEESENLVSPALKEAIDVARANIERFHYSQQSKLEIVETTPGVKCWQKSMPITKVGLYVPGGTAPLFSTVLMLGIPAAIAGCEEVVLCSPPGKDGKINPAILYTANLVGVTRVFKVGGAQAIAAMAFGTHSVPKVFKIFGPGNHYVTTAKQLVT